jgi:hypothetical protein
MGRGSEQLGKPLGGVVTQNSRVVVSPIQIGEHIKHISKKKDDTHRERLCVKEQQRKKVTWVWKPKKVRRRLVIGMDVGLKETINLSLCTLVWRFAYKKKCDTSFSTWMKKTWIPIIG